MDEPNKIEKSVSHFIQRYVVYLLAMKRLTILFLMCICITIIMAQSPVLAIKQLTIAQGDVAQLEISLENASTHYTAFQFDLTLPAGISIKKDGEGLLMVKLNDDRVSDHRFHVSEILSDTYRFLSYSMNNSNISGSSGTLIEITLNAEADNSLGTVEGQINNGLLVTANNEITELGTSEFLIKIVEKEYTLAYKVDGENYKSYKIKYGEKITPEAAPEKEGYSFSGWDNVPETMPAKDVTVKGAFTVNIYKLIYKVDGTDYKSFDVEYGSSITPESAPEKEGYSFSGWDNVPESMPAKDVIVTGSFKETTGIISVINDSPGALIYDMQGRRIEHLQKGLNIIRMSDGKTKKVMGK